MLNIFQQPWTLLAIAIIALVVLIKLRNSLRPKKFLSLLAVPAILAVTAFALDHFVQTDMEKIAAVITTFENAIKNENPSAIGPLVAENYRDSFHKTKNRLIGHLNRRLSKPFAEKVITSILEKNIVGDTAELTLTARIVFDERNYLYQNYKPIIFVKFEMQLQKQPDKNWLITKAELVELDRRPFRWKQAIQY